MPRLTAPGALAGKMSGQYPYGRWTAFNQVKELPEQLLAGRFEYRLDYLFGYVVPDESKMSAFGRAGQNNLNENASIVTELQD